ncbi:unknown protein [Seminavis robusta]|uniref:PiggyBac transposable element-derived protein domain-containing protein n=1 Tax=Seminavis robusta TaxID=568900 RepID=A0A9N8EIS3_9STRA|nr:unknown protein [Seminavis robusta]|eukprot:Sro1022_g232310.1 n/a (722) ;mRNA; f:5324-7489
MSSRGSFQSSRRRTRTTQVSTVGEDSASEEEEDLVEEPPDIIETRPDDPWDDEMSDAMPHQQANEEEEDEDEPVSETTLNSLIRELKWKYARVENPQNKQLDSTMQRFYDGPQGLRHGIAEPFTTPFDCFEHVSGVDRTLIARLAAGSNDYFHRFIKIDLDRNNRWHGVRWEDISIEEMYRFLGIMLKISMFPVDDGGYEAYFRKENKYISPGGGAQPMEIYGSSDWAHQYMTLSRFKQIRGAFHPEDKSVGLGGDKCYQLRHLINSFNAASSRTFHVPRDLAFDEGGVGCRSRYCPVRQYNKDKPQKFRVDFFICSCARTYQILHLDVYQGRNGNNVGIHDDLVDLPTTQKAVANAAYSLKLHQSHTGARHISMDNRYRCPELAVMLREKCKLYSTGTCRTNRKGWKEAELDLKKTNSNRGTSILAYDDQNRVTICQWVDSKVVNVVSTLNDASMKNVQRQVGSNKETFECPAVLVEYQEDMGAIDRSDQMRGHEGGFSQKAHFKKWYKKSYLAIVDCWLLNSLIAWNLSCGDAALHRRRLKRQQFYQYIAQSLLNFKDTVANPVAAVVVREATQYQFADGARSRLPQKASRANTRCSVCRLEQQWVKSLGEKGMTSDVATCSDCGVSAHAVVLTDSNRQIHQLHQFRGLSCFQIMHSVEGYQLWKRTTKGRNSFEPSYTHPIRLQLRQFHNLPPERAGKRKRDNAEGNDEYFGNEDGDG